MKLPRFVWQTLSVLTDASPLILAGVILLLSVLGYFLNDNRFFVAIGIAILLFPIFVWTVWKTLPDVDDP